MAHKRWGSHKYNSRTEPYSSLRGIYRPYSSFNESRGGLNFEQTALVVCKVYMISENRFAVNTSRYHEELVKVFRKIPSRAYVHTTRIWDFHLKDYELFQQYATELMSTSKDIVVDRIPESIIRLCKLPKSEIELSYLNSIEPTLAEQLLPFQQEGVCFAIARNGFAMICDEMGLGKTHQALAIADYYKEHWPLFICTTATTRASWHQHISLLLPQLADEVIVFNHEQQCIHNVKVLITTYKMLIKHLENIIAQKYQFLIFDESHLLKNRKAKCTKAAKRLAKKAKHVILLTGTPELSRPEELYAQIQLIDPKFMNYIEFTKRYCNGYNANGFWNVYGQSNAEELIILLKRKYMIRRTKAEVQTILPEKSREIVLLDLPLFNKPAELEALHEMLDDNLYASYFNGNEKLLFMYYAETAAVKRAAVCAYIEQQIKKTTKFVIFAHHLIMLDAINDCLTNLNVEFVRIDGKTTSEKRAKNISTFQDVPNCQVALLSLKACNVGITLTAANLLIFAELDWNPSTLVQAEGRAHRIGQKRHVVSRYLIAKNTADEIIWHILLKKQKVLASNGLFCEDFEDTAIEASMALSESTDIMPLKKIDNNTNNSLQKALEDMNNDVENDFFEDLPF